MKPIMKVISPILAPLGDFIFYSKATQTIIKMSIKASRIIPPQFPLFVLNGKEYR